MLEEAKGIQDQIIAWRRDFHMHPEVGFQETRTADKIAEILRGFGCEVRTGVGRTGVMADLGEGEKTIAIRADMDALPLQESGDHTYASRVPGIMHACGHDAHCAMALGVAALLSNKKLPGRVRFLFQPAEEVGDEEGISGAPRMIEDGAMEGVDMVIATHVDSHSKVGITRIEPGPFSGGVDNFYASIIGHGGHGARPHDVVDPIYISAHVLLALHGIVSRRLDPFAPAVISIGSIHGGHAENIIPEQVDISGTIRFMDPDVQKQIHAEIEGILGIARNMGGDYQLRFEIGTMPVINHPEAVRLIHNVAAEMLGEAQVLPRIKGMGAEDFGCFTELAPGAMFNLGARIEGDERLHHNPRFDIDEGCLPIGTAILAKSALRFLQDG